MVVVAAQAIVPFSTSLGLFGVQHQRIHRMTHLPPPQATAHFWAAAALKDMPTLSPFAPLNAAPCRAILQSFVSTHEDSSGVSKYFIAETRFYTVTSSNVSKPRILTPLSLIRRRFCPS